MVIEAVRPQAQAVAPQIAVIDDDPLFLDTFAANLRDGGYRVATFTSTKAILAGWFEGLRPVAVLVEARDASRDHGALPRALRSIGYGGPIVLLTGDAPREDRTSEWIAKTLSPPAMLRQLARVIGDAPPEVSAFSVGALELDPASDRAVWKGRPVVLGRCEMAMTALLAQRTGLSVSYRELFQAVHTDLFASGTAAENYRMFVRAAAERLRHKFIAVDSHFACIEHQAGIGYRWRA